MEDDGETEKVKPGGKGKPEKKGGIVAGVVAVVAVGKPVGNVKPGGSVTPGGKLKPGGRTIGG